MPFGTPGGDVQCQAMAQVFLNIHLFGMEVQEAIEAPRFATYSHPDSFEPHMASPGKVKMENRIPASVGEDLQRRGHDLEWWPEIIRSAGAVCTIVHDQENGRLYGGADPRRQSGMMGW
jgi:gamma-glutamyltranspeptidase/glutathione hydrolase